jgi:ATP-dependent 26S proteasome regulatory subunit
MTSAGAPERGSGPERKAAPPFVRELDTLIRARYPLVYLVSWEEQRLDAILEGLANTHGKTAYFWSITLGLRKVTNGRPGQPLDGSKDPVDALRAVERIPEPSVFVFKDFHPFLNDPVVVRWLRELAQQLKASYSTVVLVSPTVTIPVELEKEISVLDVPLPTFDDLRQLLDEITDVVRKGRRAVVDLDNAQTELLLKAALGLTLSEAENAFAKAIALDNRLDAGEVALILEEKRQVIRKSGLLEYYNPQQSLSGVGGLDNLKVWLGRRAVAFRDEARRFGLPEPKGLLLLGVQGCGKSLTAQAVAAQWGLPLLRLDIGRIFSGLVGSSEENMRKAIRVAESVAPVVLWIDEIEKGLSGTASSGVTDGGVTARIFGALLTWLQEKTAAVFVVATANRIESLPPELLRKGRFDEIFFVDLPSAEERREIFEIHLLRRHREPASYDLKELVRLTEGFSGAEIEQAIIEALFEAFGDRTELQHPHLVHAIQETLPLSTTMKEGITRLREWARTRTRPASAATWDEPEHPLASRFS